MRVLNIIVDESRLLASRERCPYLIHVEVADTGLDGSDARLYASDCNGLGTTVEEALGLGSATSATAMQQSRPGPAYEIPPELLAEPALISPSGQSSNESRDTYDSVELQTDTVVDDYDSSISIPLPRGGWQADDEGVFYPEATGFGHATTPYEELVRQEEYEQLHQQMQVQQEEATAAAQTQVKILNK